MDARFEQVTRLADARAALRGICVPHGRTESCPVPAASGRVLASSISSRRDVPHYDRAAMDGFAVQAADTFEASERSPVTLEPTEGHVETGRARQVHTGSAVPEGADAVVRVESTETRAADLLVSESVAPGENVADAGEDVNTDEHLFDAGHRLRPSDLALLRAAGVSEVQVVPPVHVAVIPTGDELVAPDADPAPGETVETNGLLVASLVERWGGNPTHREVVGDDADALASAIERDADYDVVVTTGGSSVGERDLLPEVLADVGEVAVHDVAIKPGHPVGFGHVDDTPVITLPGYPVSCLLTAVQFLRPAIAWIGGTEPAPHPSVRARLTEKLPSAPGERTFARMRFVDEGSDVDADLDGEPHDYRGVEPLWTAGAGVMSSVTFADGWVEVSESREGIPAGEVVTVQKWERGW